MAGHRADAMRGQQDVWPAIEMHGKDVFSQEGAWAFLETCPLQDSL